MKTARELLGDFRSTLPYRGTFVWTDEEVELVAQRAREEMREEAAKVAQLDACTYALCTHAGHVVSRESARRIRALPTQPPTNDEESGT